MTREEAISILKTFRITGDKAHEAFDMAIKALEQRWIPVSERLPERDDEVLATDGVDMFVAWYSIQEWKSFDSNYDRYTPIVAWMPLPEPYKGVEE